MSYVPPLAIRLLLLTSYHKYDAHSIGNAELMLLCFCVERSMLDRARFFAHSFNVRGRLGLIKGFSLSPSLSL